MSFITINLKLFKPSKEKRKIIELAMENYSRAFDYLIEKAFCDIELLEQHISKPNSQLEVAKWISGDISDELNNFHIQPFKDSIKADFAMFISGYFALKKKFPDTPKPLTFVDGKELEKLYFQYLQDVSIGDAAQYSDQYVEKLIGKEGKFRPIYFCRTDRFRDFCFLYDENTSRYFVKIYLLNSKSPLKRVQASKDRNLKYIHKLGGTLENSGNKDRFIILPLAFGKWQENYLKRTLENPTMIKTSRLKKIKEDLYISVTLEIKDVKAFKTKHFLSISRGIKEPLNYAVANLDGSIVETGTLLKDSEFNEKDITYLLYKTVKKICDIALKHDCEVLTEALNSKSDYVNFKDREGVSYHTLFKKNHYLELLRILKYKLPLSGMGKLLELSPLDIFYRCPVCYSLSKGNRFKYDIFICTSCATLMDIDKLGSINLALKVLNYKKSRIIVRSVQMDGGILFKNEVLGLECFCENSNVNYVERIISEMKKITETVDFYSISKKKQSLILKIKNTEDLTKILTII